MCKMAGQGSSSEYGSSVINTKWLLLTLISTLLIWPMNAKKLRLDHMPKHHPPESHHAEPEHSFVLTFNNASSLDEAIEIKHSFIAVMFYAPWCGHSRRLAPHWTDASVVLRNTNPGIILGKVDMTKKGNADLRQRYGIRGFPTLFVFKAHSELPYSFRGAQDVDGIVSYLTIERERCKECVTTVDEENVEESHEAIEHGF